MRKKDATDGDANDSAEEETLLVEEFYHVWRLMWF
jgi:hypothetical protein